MRQQLVQVCQRRFGAALCQGQGTEQGHQAGDGVVALLAVCRMSSFSLGLDHRLSSLCLPAGSQSRL